MSSYVRKHLIYLKAQNMIDINVVMLQWFISYLTKKSASLVDKSTSGARTRNEIISNKELAKDLRFTN